MNSGHPGVDWKNAPKRAQWWAINKDGQAFWFCKPDVAAFTDFWFSEMLIAPAFDYSGDYKASLTPRPAQLRSQFSGTAF